MSDQQQYKYMTVDDIKGLDDGIKLDTTGGDDKAEKGNAKKNKDIKFESIKYHLQAELWLKFRTLDLYASELPSICGTFGVSGCIRFPLKEQAL